MSARPQTSWPFLVTVFLLALAIAAVFWRVFDIARPPAPPVPPKIPWKLSALGSPPVWRFARSEHALTHDEFVDAIEKIYGTEKSWESTIKVRPRNFEITEAVAVPSAGRLVIGFRAPAETPYLRDAQQYWRPPVSLPPIAKGSSQPLADLKIAIDPGHIGGDWAKMEERWYRMAGQRTEVKEGDLTLETAEVLQPELESLGATVTLVRENREPLTAMRPEDFVAITSSRGEAELYFYRKAEIRARADLVNKRIRPDMVICLHLNAEAWGDPDNVRFVDANHLHLIVNGHYSAEELEYDDVRCDMLRRLFQRIDGEEIRLANAVSLSLARVTGLPAYDYKAGPMSGSAHRVLPENPYVWARNLMANRLYVCPVIYCEPYVMNSREVYERVAAGDYEGEKLVAGKMRPSLVREYAHGVADGLKQYYSSQRRTR